MNNKLEIKKKIELFVMALEKDDMSLLDKVMLQNIEFYSTHLGNIAGLNSLKEKLRWKGNGTDINFAKYYVFNYVCFSEKDRAQTSFYINGLVGIDDDDGFYPMNFGGKYAVSWTKWNDEWYMQSIRYVLDFIDQNNIFIRDWWNSINHNFYDGHNPTTIISELDSPFRVIKHREESLDDQEQIEELFYKYAWAIDTADFNLLYSVFTEDLDGQFHHSKGKGIRHAVEMFIHLRHKEATFQHTVSFQKIEVKGNHAKALIYRHEPHRLGSKVLWKENKNVMFWTQKWENEFRKEDGKWKISVFKSIPKVFTEIPSEKDYFL